MKWEGRRESTNVEDRRMMTPGRLAVGGGLGALLLALIVALMGGDPRALLNFGEQQQEQPGEPRKLNPEQERAKKLVAVVLADTEDVWHKLFKENGLEYREPKLVYFTGRVDTACGQADSAVGPFYCPGDEKVYIDLDFFEEMRTRFKAPGEFAQAYVVAHEVGHHVQNLLGTMGKVHQAQQRLRRSDEVEANHLSVRLELQADYLAGVWAHHADKAKHILEQGDVEAAIRAAQAIGDDTLQKQARGTVMPDAFTHGSSAQRVRWFTRGLKSGKLSDADELFKLDYNQL